MPVELAPGAIARHPTQKRARERFERILDEARRLLQDDGLAGFSIPTLAERLDYTRGSIYAYFPTPFAILNELAIRYLDELDRTFKEQATRLAQLGLEDSIEAGVDIAVDFYNQHPVARILILGGAVTDQSYRAQEILNKRLGELAAAMWNQRVALPAQAPDVFTLAVDIGTACFRRSCFEHDDITPAYKAAAIQAMRGFLLPWTESARHQPAA